MSPQIRKGFFWLCFWLSPLQAEEFSDVTMRFHSQWDVGDQERQRLLEKYGVFRVTFDQEGHAVPHGLSPEQTVRWQRFYELCMCDGCYFCDASEGSCERGTCGPQNANCRPYISDEGMPKCGLECADYAFTSTLI